MRERLRIDLIIYSLLLLCLTAFKVKELLFIILKQFIFIMKSFFLLFFLKSCQTDSVENCTYFPNYPNKTLVKFIM